MVTFEDVYRDINQTLSSEDVWTEGIYHNDTVNAINDAIRTTRLEYIGNGLGHEFLTTETLTFTEDTDYPFYTSTLTYPVLRSLPIHNSVYVSSYIKSSDEVQDIAQSFSKGDIVYKDKTLYKVVDDVSSINVYNETFDPKDVRLYYTGMDVKEGHILKNGSDYYRVTSNQESLLDSDLSGFDKLYLMRIGGAYDNATHVPFSRLYELSLDGDVPANFFTVKDSKVYSSTDKNMTISYIGEWQDVTDLSQELEIADTMIPAVKQTAINTLRQKLGIVVDE